MKFDLFFSLPARVSGAVGAMVQKELTFCGGLHAIISTEAASTAATASKGRNDSYASECYKWTYQGWKRHKSMTKPRAFAASAWVIIKAKKAFFSPSDNEQNLSEKQYKNSIFIFCENGSVYHIKRDT